MCGCVLVTLVSATAGYNFHLPYSPETVIAQVDPAPDPASDVSVMYAVLASRPTIFRCLVGKEPAPLRCEQEKPVLIRL